MWTKLLKMRVKPAFEGETKEKLIEIIFNNEEVKCQLLHLGLCF